MTKIETVWDAVLCGPIPPGRVLVGKGGRAKYERAWRKYWERQAELKLEIEDAQGEQADG